MQFLPDKVMQERTQPKEKKHATQILAFLDMKERLDKIEKRLSVLEESAKE